MNELVIYGSHFLCLAITDTSKALVYQNSESLSQAKSGNKEGKEGQFQAMEGQIGYAARKMYKEVSHTHPPLIMNSLVRYVRQILRPHFIEK